MLVGRDAERRRIEQLIQAACAGQGRALVVRGEAGVGKTALLEHTQKCADGMRRLGARGIESESDLAFASLHELLRPLLAEGRTLLDGLPRPQRDALGAALGFAPAVASDPVVTYAATLGVLTLAAAERPLIATVDDAQWLDHASGAALAFAARRLGSDRLCMLFALREGEESSFDPSGIEQLELRGLGEDDAMELLARSAGAALGRSQARRLVAATLGNPLALLELSSTSELDDVEPFGAGPPRGGTAVEQAFARRLRRLPEDARLALLVAAATDTGSMRHIGRALSVLGSGVHALAPAERLDLVTIGDGRLEFRHPLVRSVAYHGADPGRRRAVHGALAAAMLEDGAADRRAWHLAAAAVEPDEDVAQALEAAAGRARARGGLASAARALERAARLSPEAEERARRLALAAEALQLLGRSARARGLLLEAADEPTSETLRTDVELLRGRVEARSGSSTEAASILVGEADRVAVKDPARAARLLAEAADPALRAGEPARALEIAERACALGGRAPGTAGLYAALARGAALVFVGRPSEAAELVTGVADALGRDLADPQLASYLGMTLAFVEDDARARPILRSLVELGRERGLPGALPYPLIALAWLDRTAGRFADAVAALGEAAELSRRDGRGIDLCWALSVLAWIEAAQGREDQCRVHAREQIELHRLHGLPYQHMTAEAALGLLALGQGRNEDATRHLSEALEIKLAHGYCDATTQPLVGPDLVEALVRGGQLDRAAAETDRFAEGAEASGRDSALAPLARCRGLVAGERAFEPHFREALERHDRAHEPFARARTALCFAERLHRTNRRAEAGRWLAAAAETFERLGATPFSRRAESTRSRSAAPRRPERSAADVLTDTELRLAALVADGKTNKEIAGTLWVSDKTVEAHLRHIFVKLSLRNRQQLTRWWLENRAA